MGNWRSISIVGTCDESEVEALEKAITYGEDYSNFHCLVNTGGLGSLGNWARSSINAMGNLSERDYSVEDVAERLRLIAETAPSLAVKVHCGGDWESKDCVATVTLQDGTTAIGEPEIDTIPALSDDAIAGRLYQQLFRHP